MRWKRFPRCSKMGHDNHNTTLTLLSVCQWKNRFAKISVQEVKWRTNWPINDLTVILDYNRECMLTLVVFVLCLFMCNNHDKLWNCTWKTSTGQSNLLCPSVVLLITVPRHLRHQITRTNGGLTLAGLNFYIQPQGRPKNLRPLMVVWREFVGDDTCSLVGWSLRLILLTPERRSVLFCLDLKTIHFSKKFFNNNEIIIK